MQKKTSPLLQRAINDRFDDIYKLRSAEDQKPYSDAVKKHLKPDSVPDFGVSRDVIIRVKKHSFKINYTQWYRGVPQFKHDPEHMDDDEWYYPKRNVTVARTTLINREGISDIELNQALNVGKHIAIERFMDLYQTRMN